MKPQEDNIQLPSVQPIDPDDQTTVDHTQALQPDPSMQQTPLTSSNAGTDEPAGPPTAEDVDLIEKAWVEKAKDIVKGTMGDPHAQSEEISKMKADYIKKRYNKDIRSEG